MTEIEVGFVELPSSTSQIRQQVLQVMESNSENFFNSGALYDYCRTKTRRYFSDLLWNLAKSGEVVLVQRGFYKFNKSK